MGRLGSVGFGYGGARHAEPSSNGISSKSEKRALLELRQHNNEKLERTRYSSSVPNYSAM